MSQLQAQASQFARWFGFGGGIAFGLSASAAGILGLEIQIPSLAFASLVGTILCGLIFWQVSGVQPNGSLRRSLWEAVSPLANAGWTVFAVSFLSSLLDGLFAAALSGYGEGYWTMIGLYVALKLAGVLLAFVVLRSFFRPGSHRLLLSK